MSDNPDKFKYTFADDKNGHTKMALIELKSSLEYKTCEQKWQIAKSIAELPRTYGKKVRRPVMRRNISSKRATSDYDFRRINERVLKLKDIQTNRTKVKRRLISAQMLLLVMPAFRGKGRFLFLYDNFNQKLHYFIGSSHITKQSYYYHSE